MGIANGDGMHGADLGLQAAVSGSDLDATLQSLERAAMLPKTAFLEPSVLDRPYHAWSYDLEGSLRAVPQMEGVEDFDTACYGLAPIPTAVLGGLVLVNLSGEAGPPEDHVGEFLPHLEHYSVGALARAGIVEYEVRANWKGIAENYDECLQCPGVHPELYALNDYMSGENLYGAGAWCGGSMEEGDIHAFDAMVAA